MCNYAKHNQRAYYANARGLGHALRKFLKNRCFEIESEGILEAKYLIMYINFKSQNFCEIKTSAINMIWRSEGEQLIIIILP